jgi:hypothetical protein
MFRKIRRRDRKIRERYKGICGRCRRLWRRYRDPKK